MFFRTRKKKRKKCDCKSKIDRSLKSVRLPTQHTADSSLVIEKKWCQPGSIGLMYSRSRIRFIRDALNRNAFKRVNHCAGVIPQSRVVITHVLQALIYRDRASLSVQQVHGSMAIEALVQSAYKQFFRRREIVCAVPKVSEPRR